jgi:hypothetical protein
MFNLFKAETQESMIKLIATQSDLITLQKEAAKDRDETIRLLKRLVKVQELQIFDLKLKLRELREKQ